MNTIKVESQWNNNNEMMLNIPNFPHLHSSINTIFTDNDRYPHPYQYFLASLAGIITLIIKKYSEKNCLLIINLYITVEGELINNDTIKSISVEIRLNSNANPTQFTELQKLLNNDNSILSLFKDNIIKINWD